MRAFWDKLDRDKRLLVGSAVGLWVAQLLYLLSPLDLVPDFIPLIGWIDDLILLGSTIAFTVFVVRKVRGDVGFSGLAPDALRPRSIVRPSETDNHEPDVYEAEVAGHGDPLGIDGYRPLSLDEIRSL